MNISTVEHLARDQHSLDVDAIRKAHERGMVDGVTTNPSLVQ